jgi:hypothetical protein|tara:strand:- start:262 stop:486 length:225 start_codon:yes stop_codon:yes gene_type:complete
MLQETFYEKCIEFIKKDEFKNEIKNLLKPLIDIIIQEFYPYIYLSLIFVIISFFLILGIFILLWRNKMISNKNV